MRKGFTLIELLAVIVILAVIALIATPLIINVIDNVKKGAVENSALSYINAVEKSIVLSELDTSTTLDRNKVYDIIELNNIVEIKGDKPLEGWVYINDKGVVESGSIRYKSYSKIVNYDNISGRAEAVGEVITDIPIVGNYTVGTSVTLKDGSYWYVLNDSGGELITLISAANVDATGAQDPDWSWDWNLSQATGYTMEYDASGNRPTETNPYCIGNTKSPGSPAPCHIYAADGVDVTVDSTIKQFVDNTVTPYISNSLINSGGDVTNLDVRLITIDEFLVAVGLTMDDLTIDDSISLPETANSNKIWLTSTRYWTMTPEPDSEGTIYVWGISVPYEGAYRLYVRSANYADRFGVRPVITILKSNLQ